MNNRSKVQSVISFVAALVWLAGSLYFLTSALTYNRQQSFTPSALTYDLVEKQYLGINLKMPFITLFTVLFGLGWWCRNYSESLLLRNDRRKAIFVSLIPGILLLLFFVSATQFPHGFLESALNACGFIVVSSYYLRQSIVSPEAFVKSSERN